MSIRMTAAFGVIAMVAVAAPSDAQQSEVQQLAAVVAAERQHIADLEQELARRSAALSEISSRLALLGAPPATPPVVTAVAQPAAEAAVPPVQIYGDALMRLSTTHQDYDGCEGCLHRTVGRMRLRLGVQGQLPMGFRAAVGFATGDLNDPNSVYQTFGNNLSRKVVSWDRGFIAYQPAQASWLELMAGKFAYPWTRSSMTFDVDFYPEGGNERVAFDLHHAGPFKRATAQAFQIVVNEQANAPDNLVVGGQASTTVQFGRVTSRVIATGINITQPELMLRSQLQGLNVGVRNTNVIVGTGTNAAYASRFRYANVIAENAIKTASAAWPVTVTGEYQFNFRAATADDTAMSVRVDAGRNQRGGDWLLSYHIFRVEQEAILSGLGESDWRAPSNVLQQRIQAARTLHPQVQALFTWYRGRTLDTTVPGALLAPGLAPGGRDPWTNRFYFDIGYRFR